MLSRILLRPEKSSWTMAGLPGHAPYTSALEIKMILRGCCLSFSNTLCASERSGAKPPDRAEGRYTQSVADGGESSMVEKLTGVDALESRSACTNRSPRKLVRDAILVIADADVADL